MQDRATITYASASHQGLVRPDNQDCFGKFPEESLDISSPKGQLFIVADGMGGHQAGRVASELAVKTIQETYFSNQSDDISKNLHQAFETANEQIYQRASVEPSMQGMGTTCTALVAKHSGAWIAHVGDSRAYQITEQKIQQLTQDHSKVAQMLRQGILTEEEAARHPERSYLYRALGVKSTVEVDLIDSIPIRSRDLFLLCTDGLSKVTEQEIKQIVTSKLPNQASQELIRLANERGGTDNVTVLIVRIEGAAEQKNLSSPISR